MLPVAILAGGFASRLGPLTKKIPKSLIEVAGKPFIFHQLDYLYKQGITKVILCVGYLSEMIIKEVGDGRQFGLEVYYSCDSDFPLGTGGAIKKALPLIDESFFVLYGDSFLPLNFKSVEKYYLHSQKLALMTVIQNQNKWDKSNVIFDNGLIIEYNKNNYKPAMQYIDYGLGIFSKALFKSYKNDLAFDLAELYYKLSIENKLAGFEVFDRFYEIGSYTGLLETELYLSSL